MPRIPVGTNQLRLETRTPVPIAETRDARFTGENFRDFGKSIASASAQLYETAQKQEAADRALRRTEELGELENIIRRREAETLNGPGQDYVKEFSSLAENDINEFLSRERDPQLQKEINVFATRATEEAKTGMYLQQLKKNEKELVARVARAGESFADKAYEDPGNASLYFKTFEDEVITPLESQGVMSADDRMKLTDAARNTVAVRTFNGLLDRGQYSQAAKYLHATAAPGNENNFDLRMSPDEARAMKLIDDDQFDKLKSEGKEYIHPLITKGGEKLSPEMSAIISSLDPRQKQSFIDQLRSEMRAKETTKISTVSQQIDNIKAATLSGTEVSRETINKTMMMIDSLRVPESAKKSLKDDVVMSAQAGKATQLIAKAAPQDIAEIISQYAPAKVEGDETFNAKSRLEFTDLMKRAANDSIKARVQDPSAYTQTYFKSVKEAYAQAADGNPQATQSAIAADLTMQRYLGLRDDQTRVLSEGAANDLQAKFVAANSTSEKGFVVAQMKARYGEYFPRVMQELERRDASLKGYGGVGYLNTPGAQSIAINSLQRKKEIDDLFQKRTANLPGMEKVVERAVEAELRPYLQGFQANFPNGSASGMASSYAEIVKTETMNRLNRTTMGTSEAKEMAAQVAEEVMHKNFSVVSSKRSMIVAPKWVSEGRLSEYLEVSTSPEGLKGLGAWKPEGELDGYYQRLSKNAKWVINRNMDGMQLVIETGGRLAPIVDNTKKPIRVKFKQINEWKKRAARN